MHEWQRVLDSWQPPNPINPTYSSWLCVSKRWHPPNLVTLTYRIFCDCGIWTLTSDLATESKCLSLFGHGTNKTESCSIWEIHLHFCHCGMTWALNSRSILFWRTRYVIMVREMMTRYFIECWDLDSRSLRVMPPYCYTNPKKKTQRLHW
jgi:hypothetical protein